MSNIFRNVDNLTKSVIDEGHKHNTLQAIADVHKRKTGQQLPQNDVNKLMKKTHDQLRDHLKKMTEGAERSRSDKVYTSDRQVTFYRDPETGKRHRRKIHRQITLDRVGQEDSDINNDGTVDAKDRYLRKRRKAIAKAIGKQRHKKKHHHHVKEAKEKKKLKGSKEVSLKDGNKVVINPKMDKNEAPVNFNENI